MSRDEAFRLIDEIEHVCYDGDFVTKEYFDACSDSAYFLFEETSCVGFVYASIEDGCHYLYSISVRPEHQGRGLSKTLMEIFLNEESFGARHDKHWLHVKETNAVAISLYNKYGFAVTDWEDDFYEDGTRALIMRRGDED